MMTHPWSSAIDVAGWTLLHFIWQGLAAAAALGVLLLLVPRRRANLRYTLACLTLALMAASPVVTAWRLTTASASRVAGATAGSAIELQPSSARFAPRDSSQADPVERAATIIAVAPALRESLPPLPLLVGIWLGGVLIASLRLAGGWWRAQRLLRVGATPPGPASLEMVRRLADRMQLGRTIRVLESSRVHVPMVIGSIKPALLLPASALTGLTPRQLEAVIAHELAHITRHDYLVNLLQSCVETLLFYHPAVWWVSHTIRVEREHCCDDLAVAACGDALLYARALTELETQRRGRVSFAMAASSGSLVSRVRRLVGAAPSKRVASSAWMVAALTALMVAGAGAIGWMQGISRLVAEVPDAPVVWTAARASAAAVPPPDSTGPQPSAAPAAENADTPANDRGVHPPPAEFQEHGDAVSVQDARRDASKRQERRSRELERQTREFERQVEELTRDVVQSIEVKAFTGEEARALAEAARKMAEAALAQGLGNLPEDSERYARLSKQMQARAAEIQKRAEVMAQRAVESIDQAKLEEIMERVRVLEESLQRVLEQTFRDDAPILAPPPADVKPHQAPAPEARPAPAPDVRPAPAPAPAPRRAPQPRVPPATAKPEVRHRSSDSPHPAPPLPPPPPPAPVVAPPSLPATPAVPAAPAPPAPPEPGTIDVSNSDREWNMVWSQNGATMKMRGRGRIELTEDDADVERLAPSGFLIVEQDAGWFSWKSGNRFEARAGRDGAITRRYVIDGKNVSEAQGQAWLKTFLPPLVRDVGFGAEARVARMLKRSGPSGVLQEIARINSDGSRKLHYVQLFRQAPLDAATLALALDQARKTLHSDFELGRVLEAAADRFSLDETSAAAYARAARAVDSDFEQRRALAAALGARTLPGPAVAQLLNAAMPEGGHGIDSDFEMAELLLHVPGSSIDKAPAAYFGAARTIGSDFERRRVLTSQAVRRGLGPERIATLSRLAGEMGSDFDRAEVLLALVSHQPLAGAARESVLSAARGIGSDHERGRVLSAMLHAGALTAAETR